MIPEGSGYLQRSAPKPGNVFPSGERRSRRLQPAGVNAARTAAVPTGRPAAANRATIAGDERTARDRQGPPPGSALGGAALATALTLAGAASVAAHGDDVPPAPDRAGLAFGWSFDPTIWLPLAAAATAYLWAVRRVDRLHPATPVPRDRPAAFLLGLAAIAVALQSGIERWDTTLFSVHMVQHLILIFVAAPLLVLGAPITLVLRVATPGVRRRWILPVLSSRVVRVVGHPLVAWLAFVAVMWGSPPLAAVRRRARGSAPPRPGARPVPGDRDAVLLAGRRARSGPVPDGASDPPVLPVPADAAELVPGRRDPLLDPAAVRALRHDRADVGTDAARRPAARRRDHVGRRRRRVHPRDPARDRGLDALRGVADRATRGARGRPGRAGGRSGGECGRGIGHRGRGVTWRTGSSGRPAGRAAHFRGSRTARPVRLPDPCLRRTAEWALRGRRGTRRGRRSRRTRPRRSGPRPPRPRRRGTAGPRSGARPTAPPRGEPPRPRS